ncbi:MAG TPA: biotin/lipoate--protein ligase family protein [Stellaceae bacterium]|nr:biotin/lipoate--protein ligase family protein [Stellaceae bacterium]
MTEFTLPPPYRVVRLAPGQAALAEARAAAKAGEDEGVIFWADRADRLEFALTLKPDRPRRATVPVIYVAALAFADALGAFAPPPSPIGFGWPGDILVDGGLVGGLSLALAGSAADAIPEWAVLGFDLALGTGSEEPGRTPTHTCIAEEGFEDFSAVAQIEGFSRHFLTWLNRWDRDGFATIAAEWSRRAFAPLGPTIALPEGPATPLGLDEAGDLRVRQNRRERILSLEAALASTAAYG